MSETAEELRGEFDHYIERAYRAKAGVSMPCEFARKVLNALDALASAQAELRDVKRVEVWLKSSNHRLDRRDGMWFAEVRQPSTFPQYEPDTWVPAAYADSLAALGRLLTEGNDEV